MTSEKLHDHVTPSVMQLHWLHSRLVTHSIQTMRDDVGLGLLHIHGQST